MNEWCKDIEYREHEECRPPGWWIRLNKKTSQSLCDEVKFCPLCGTPRPEPKFIPTSKFDENGDLIIYGKDKAWKFDGIAFRQIVNEAEPRPAEKKNLAEIIAETFNPHGTYKYSSYKDDWEKSAEAAKAHIIEGLPSEDELYELCKNYTNPFDVIRSIQDLIKEKINGA